MLIPPGYHYVAVLLGIWRAGGIAVPLGLDHHIPELVHFLLDAEVSIAIVDESFKDRLLEAFDECVKQEPDREKARIYTSQEVVLYDKDQIWPLGGTINPQALILYTSGSTGKPKGVVLTHHNLEAQVDSLVQAWKWTSEDSIYHVLPLHHIHGIVDALLCPLRVGACIEFAVFPSARFNAQAVWRRFSNPEPLIESPKHITVFMAVPTIYSKLITAYEEEASRKSAKVGEWARGAKSLRLFVSGSATLPILILEKWEHITGHPLLERYGTTEIGTALSSPHPPLLRQPGHVGRPLPGVDFKD